jgi:glutamate N-acetyltransferase/amino-acid N-acetyltransferase
MAYVLSPLAPEKFPDLPLVDGVLLAVGNNGGRYKGRDDTLLIELAPGTTIAGVLTRSLACSAPVDWCRRNLVAGTARAIVVNAGNANAFTGAAGMKTVLATAEKTAGLLGDGTKPSEVFVASTGVIGVPMAPDLVPDCLARIRGKVANWLQAAQSIMTTDTFPKGATATATIDGKIVKLVGIAKGSGMIAPDMATMLGFVVTDAAIAAPVLQKILADITNKSFNAITVDGDTSTSDTLLLAATAKAGHGVIDRLDDPRLRGFKKALEKICIDLATQIVRDGEGARKFVTIDVTGAASARAARIVGLAIGNSPLVKTAIAGEDANWGRIVAAIGKAGQRADRDRLKVAMGGITIAAEGARVPDYDEAPVAAHMKGQNIHIAVDLGVGRSKARVWSCDLTETYISINADYRS